MSDLHHDELHNPSQRLPQRCDESDTMLGVFIAGIVAQLIAGIIGALTYAQDTNPVTAQAPLAPPAALSTPAPTNPTPSTTGQAPSAPDQRNAPARPRNRDVNQMGDPLSPQGQ